MSDRDDLETTADALVDERDQLGSDLDDAQAEIARLEEAASTTTTTGPDGTTPRLAGEPVFLNQLEPVAGGATTEETELGGERYRNVVRLDMRERTAAPDRVEYNLGAGRAARHDRPTGRRLVVSRHHHRCER